MGISSTIFSHPIFKCKHSKSDLGSGVCRSKVASRANEVFFAKDNTIRCGIVGIESQVSFKTLSIQVPFAIQSINMNISGTLLAIIGSQRLFACMLPSPGFMGLPEEVIDVKSWEVGSLFAGESTIQKVIWNPVHRYDSEIVILTSNSYVRSFDLMTSHETPDQEVNLEKQSSEGFSGMMGLATIEESFTPVSICFGSSGEPHGKLTLFVLSREGDVYAVCPFVPKSFILTQNELEELFDSAVAAEFEYRHSEGSSIPVRRHYKQQLDWISELWKQMAMTIVETRSPYFGGPFEKYLVLARPRNQSIPEVQGPFLLEPYPEEFYLNESVDIESLNIGMLTLFCITFNNGSVLLCAQTQQVDLNWSTESIELNLGLSVIESISLYNGTSKPGVCVTDPNSMGFFVMSESFVHRIDVTSWADPISSAIESGDIETFERIMENAPQSDIAWLIDQRSASRFIGLFAFHDNYGQLHTAVVTDQQIWVEKWESNEAVSAIAEEKSYIKEKQPSELTTYLGTPFNAERALNSIALRPRLADSKVLLTEKMALDWDDLTTLNGLGEFYGGELEKLHRIGLSMHGRLIDQRTELHRQLEKVAIMPDKLTAIIDDDTSERALETIERQRVLQERLDTLRSRLSDRGIVLLSDQEKSWAGELNRLKNTITNTRGLDFRVNSAVQQSKVIIDESKLRKITERMQQQQGQQQSKLSTERAIPGLETENSIRLKQAIALESELVGQTKATLESLIKSMEKLSC